MRRQSGQVAAKRPATVSEASQQHETGIQRMQRGRATRHSVAPDIASARKPSVSLNAEEKGITSSRQPLPQVAGASSVTRTGTKKKKATKELDASVVASARNQSSETSAAETEAADRAVATNKAIRRKSGGSSALPHIPRKPSKGDAQPKNQQEEPVDCTAAAADGNAQEHGRKPSKNAARWKYILDAIDSSRDGLINHDEFMKVIRTFADICPSVNVDFVYWDLDQDGMISSLELGVFLDSMLSLVGARLFRQIEMDILEKARQSRDSKDIAEHAWGQMLSEADGLGEAVDPVQELRKAMEATEPRILRKAIRDAQSCGVDRALIKEAKAALKRLEALAKLEEAIESGDAGILRIALRELKSAGVPKEEMEKAEKLVKIFAVRGALGKAITKKDYQGFLDALTQGTAAGMDEEELDAYRQHVPLLQAEASLKLAVSSENAEDIMQFITEGLRVGVDPDVIAEVEKKLPAIRERETMRGKLQQVITSGTSAEIRKTIHLASDLKIEGKEMDRAKVVLRKMEAREELNVAVQNERAVPLRAAIKRAQDAELDHSLIEHAEQVLARLELQVNLSAALIGNDIEELRALVKATRDFIARGWATGVKDDQLQKAEWLIRTMDEQEALKRKSPHQRDSEA